MLYVKALHIISIIAWFSGLLYLPRLIACYYKWVDNESRHYLPIMATKLYNYIMNPAALCSLVCGCLLISANPTYYWQQFWLQVKMAVVTCLVIYHVYLGIIVGNLSQTLYLQRSSYFYKILHIIPGICCVVIVALSVIQPNVGAI
jgi:putative membrane protein